MHSPAAEQLIGASTEIVALRNQLLAVARARRTTLITGPSGSGKEVVAAVLHSSAFDDSVPFVPVHCGALPEQLAEAELFGHTRGAFTGATSARQGLVRAADKGTLFLDEVDSLSVPVQAKLLRFLEAGEYRPVGADRSDRAQVWVIAATNRDLSERVRAGAFREDLLFRLDFMQLDIPPLRLRGADIELLARHFLALASLRPLEFTECALNALNAHTWPGNVRELKHRVERAAILASGSYIDAAALQLAPSAATRAGGRKLEDDLWSLVDERGLTLGQVIDHCERVLINAALKREHENRTRAAERLGIHVRTIFKKLHR
jgi:DNA-binding NtrC family response regulator